VGKAGILVVVLVLLTYGCAFVKRQEAARSSQILQMMVRG